MKSRLIKCPKFIGPCQLTPSNRKNENSGNLQVSKASLNFQDSLTGQSKRPDSGSSTHRSKPILVLKSANLFEDPDIDHQSFPLKQRCYICEKDIMCSDKTSLRTHMWSTHGPEPHRCSFCPKKFKYLRKLMYHEAQHTGVEKFACSLCKTRYHCAADVKYHIKRTHLNMKMFSCPKCNDKFRSKNAIKTHLDAKHSDERKFGCEKCGKRFKLKNILARHIQSHLPSENLPCPKCGKRFSRRYILARHVKLHTAGRNITRGKNASHKCVDCKKTFASAAGLKKHMKVHSESRTYNCTMCESSFKTKSS
eukprot:417411_1